MCTNFKEVRGLPSIGQRITTEAAKGNKVILVLDHSWLERYGMNWLTKKASILLNYGASQLFLPRDKYGEIEEMLAGKHSHDICIRTEVQDLENPLFVATTKYLATLNSPIKKNASGRTNDYTIPGQRFIEITRFFFSCVRIALYNA